MTSLQIIQLVFGFVFALLVVVFLMIAYFKKGDITPGQWAILRFLCAFCAGCAGFFITGQALFEMSGETVSGAKVAVSGTAGFALFFAVWFFFGRATAAPLPPAFNFAIPSTGWTFKAAAEAIAKTQNHLVDFQGFDISDLNAPLKGANLDGTTAMDALRNLQYLRGDGVIRSFSVEDVNPHYRLRVNA